MVLLTAGCLGAEPSLRVRLHNTTELDFDSLAMGTLKFGPLRAGEFSAYQGQEGLSLFHLEPGKAEAGALQFWGILIDRDGARPTGEGVYTYEVRASLGGAFVDGYDGEVFFYRL